MAHPNPEIKLQPQSRFPWPIVALLAAAVLLAAAFYYLPRAPKNVAGPARGQIPQQPFGDTLRLSDINMAQSPTGGQLVLAGKIQNTGSNRIENITVNLHFRDANGAIVHQETQPLEVMEAKGSRAEPKPLQQDPLKPTGRRTFRVEAQVPSAWNHQVPEIVVEHVVIAGQQSGEPTSGQAGVAPGLRERANPRLPASDVTTSSDKG